MATDKKELLAKLADLGHTKSAIEVGIGMGKNCLSKHMNGHVELPNKWIKPIQKYLKLHAEPEQEQVTIPVPVDESVKNMQQAEQFKAEDKAEYDASKIPPTNTDEPKQWSPGLISKMKDSFNKDNMLGSKEYRIDDEPFRLKFAHPPGKEYGDTDISKFPPVPIIFNEVRLNARINELQDITDAHNKPIVDLTEAEKATLPVGKPEIAGRPKEVNLPPKSKSLPTYDKERNRIEPPKGSNAYFLKYGRYS